MSNRERLELAAKAAGLDVVDIADYGNALVLRGGVWWRPRTNDGDALQLAVKLRLHIGWDGCEVRVFNENVTVCEIWHDKLSAEAATRRAITIAAAELGKAMQ